MVSKKDIENIVILSYLTEPMIEKLLPLLDMSKTEEREVIFREGDIADKFYMVKRGKVLLEQRISDRITVSMGSVKPGYAFGWSAMLDDKLYTSDAVCAEPCELVYAKTDRLKELLEQDHSMGYYLTQRLLRVIKKRLDHRTDQFVRLIQNHPDLQSLFKS